MPASARVSEADSVVGQHQKVCSACTAGRPVLPPGPLLWAGVCALLRYTRMYILSKVLSFYLRWAEYESEP